MQKLYKKKKPNEHNITNIIAINKQKEKLSPKKIPSRVVIL